MIRSRYTCDFGTNMYITQAAGINAYCVPYNVLYILKFLLLQEYVNLYVIWAYHYSTLGLIYPWRVTRDVLRTRPSQHSNSAFFKIFHSNQ